MEEAWPWLTTAVRFIRWARQVTGSPSCYHGHRPLHPTSRAGRQLHANWVNLTPGSLHRVFMLIAHLVIAVSKGDFMRRLGEHEKLANCLKRRAVLMFWAGSCSERLEPAAFKWPRAAHLAVYRRATWKRMDAYWLFSVQPTITRPCFKVAAPCLLPCFMARWQRQLDSSEPLTCEGTELLARSMPRGPVSNRLPGRAKHCFRGLILLPLALTNDLKGWQNGMWTYTSSIREFV